MAKGSVNIKRNLIWGLIFVIALILAINIFLNRFTRHNQEIIVPDFYAMSLEDATQLALQGPFRLEVIDSVFVKRLEKGAIFSQNPAAGSAVKKNRRILLTVNSSQSQKVAMPDLVGLSLRQASAEIQAKGLRIGKLIYTEDMANNNVLGQKLHGADISAGTMIETESNIDLLLGLSPDNEGTEVPYVKGMTYFEAINAIHYNSLNVGQVIYDNSVTTYNDSLEARVYRQIPDIIKPESDTIYIEPISAQFGEKVSIYLTKDSIKISEINK